MSLNCQIRALKSANKKKGEKIDREDQKITFVFTRGLNLTTQAN